MDSIISFPTPEPELKVARPPAEKWAATLAEERLRLQEDQDSLRERESNLREYESRLRMLQAEIEAGRTIASATNTPIVTQRSTPPMFQRPSSRAPFTDDPALQVAWEKLHRAREILEAEQRNLRDDRVSIREQEVMVKQRLEEIAEREVKLSEREAVLAAATPPPVESVVSDEPAPVSTVTRLTRAPMDLARSVFGGKKSG
jgi:chromosome segregation ATPase